MPSDQTIVAAMKTAFKFGRPVICLDYWEDSFNGQAFIGVRPDKTKFLCKTDNEQYTSPAEKFFKAGEDMLVLTQNSVYIINGKTQARNVSKSYDDSDDEDVGPAKTTRK